MKKGFTLLELIVVIIIIGLLATLGLTQYTKVVEKGRAAEARSVLGALRTAEAAYYLENQLYATVANLPVGAPTDCSSQTTHYFNYSCETGDGKCTATRCTSGGKSPAFTGTAYSIAVNQAGVWDLSNAQGY